MLYILMSCVLTLPQKCPTIFKPREIHNFNQGNNPFHLVACQWHHTPSTKEYTCVSIVVVRHNSVCQRVYTYKIMWLSF